MPKVIDGKSLASEIEQKLIASRHQWVKPPVVVSILIGSDPSSLIYTKLKKRQAEKLGIMFKVRRFPEDVDLQKVKSYIRKLNEDPKVAGVMIQLPAPEGLIELIDPRKDIDGLTGRGPFQQATVRGVLTILENLSINLSKKIFAVVGAKGMVGQAMVQALKKRGVQVIEVDQKIPGSSLMDLQKADVVISCVGVKNLIKPEHIKSQAILIDVGLGDFDPKTIEKSSFYTPEKGGVGPLTVVSLMENIVECLTKEQDGNFR